MGWILMCYSMNNILIHVFFFIFMYLLLCTFLSFTTKKTTNPHSFTRFLWKATQAVQTSNIPHPYITIYMYISMWHGNFVLLSSCTNRQLLSFIIFLYFFIFTSFHYIAAMEWKITNDDIGKSLDMTTSANNKQNKQIYGNRKRRVCVYLLLCYK